MDERDILDSYDFYEVMQRYRWASEINGGLNPAIAFEEVKEWIRAHARVADSADEGRK